MFFLFTNECCGWLDHKKILGHLIGMGSEMENDVEVLIEQTKKNKIK